MGKWNLSPLSFPFPYSHLYTYTQRARSGPPLHFSDTHFDGIKLSEFLLGKMRQFFFLFSSLRGKCEKIERSTNKKKRYTIQFSVQFASTFKRPRPRQTPYIGILHFIYSFRILFLRLVIKKDFLVCVHGAKSVFGRIGRLAPPPPPDEWKLVIMSFAACILVSAQIAKI